MAGTIETHPLENPNWRKHKNACPFYRERWFPCNDVLGEPMYQVFCLKNTPPVTLEEQEKCFRSKTGCWRLREKQGRMENSDDEHEREPVETQKRDRPR